MLPSPSDPASETSPRHRLSRRMLLGAGALAAAAVAIPARRAHALGPQLTLQSPTFDVSIDAANGGVFRLANPSDALRTNYVINPDLRPSFDVDDSRWVGDMVFRTRRAGAATSSAAVTSLSDDIRTVTSSASVVTTAYQGAAARTGGIRDFALTQTYRLSGTARDRLEWTFTLRNTLNVGLEFEDVGFPLLMNSFWDGVNQTNIYEQNVGRHSFVADDGSYIYWQRPNGTGPYLVMIPQAGTSLEFKNKARYGEGPYAENDPGWEGVVEYYIHSKNIARERSASAAAYLPATSLTLAPGASKTYGFTFRWAQNYQDLRDVLFDAGVVDVISLPGMVIPTDHKATLAVRAKAGITGVVGEAGKSIAVSPLGQRNGYSLYQLTLPTAGANKVTVNYGAGLTSVLQYYVVQPVETLIKARADFVAAKQQARTTRGYNGAFLQWDMTRKQQISWDNYPGGGWMQWMAGGSDDLGLAPAMFLAQKNLIRPVQAEISALDYYLQNYILGYLQARTENGQRTWQVYRWYDGRDSAPFDQGVWRVYNYVHIANTYLLMYRLKRAYPTLQTAFTPGQYLDMAYQTINAMFTKVPLPTPIGDAARDVGLMGELLYPDLLASLQAEGMGAQVATLRSLLGVKRDRLFAQKYPFASEASIDTTGFEACYTMAVLYGNTELADKVQLASLASRGLQPLWYFYGSDNRHMGESWWNLGYETHLGAWQQQEYLTAYAPTSGVDFDDAMRSTYGAYLGGWANINSGQISADPANYGAASWIYQSEKGQSNYDWIPNLDGWWAWSGEADLGFWGGLRTAGVNVVEDRVVGLYAYGGDVALAGDRWTITPRDGVRQRFTLFNAAKLSVSIERARYTAATVTVDRRDIQLTLQSPVAGTSSPDITVTRLPAGSFVVSIDGGPATRQFTTDGSPTTISLQGVPDGARVHIYAVGGPMGSEIAPAAALAASYTASWNRLAALTDGAELGLATEDQSQLWGTYRATGRPASDSVTATWPTARTVRAVSLSLWNDAPVGASNGVALPARWSVEYRDASGQWRAVTLNAGEGYPVNPAGRRSTVGFTAVTTTAVRVTLFASGTSGGYAAVAASRLAIFSE